MKTRFTNLLFVVPTRNRADLAIHAVQSVLEQGHDEATVVVSDNSTVDAESATLLEFYQKSSNDRLRYMRPSEPLSMTQHWQWAIEQVLEQYDASHFSYLTDRMVLRPGEVGKLVELAKSHPLKVISYNHDRLVDHMRPIRVEQSAWTGEVFKLPSSTLLNLTAGAFLAVPALPRMLNCMAPRSVLCAIHERHGNVFDSVNPDFSFCYRCLELEESILYYDKSPLIQHALHRSNGASLERGMPNRDHVDFLTHVGEGKMTQFTYVPQIRTVGNTVLNEYLLVKRQTKSVKFPDVDRELYLESLAGEIERIQDATLKADLWTVLNTHGYVRSKHRMARLKWLLSRLRSPRSILNALLMLSTSSFGGAIWLALAHRTGIRPPRLNRLEFDTVEKALSYAVHLSPRKARTPGHLYYLGKPSSLQRVT